MKSSAAPVVAQSLTTAATAAAFGCGAEPARRSGTGLGPSLYVDADAGKRYLDCIGAQQLAKEKAIYDAIVNRAAGGPDGCGPEPAYNLTSSGTKSYGGTGSPYTGAPLGAAWAKCRSTASSSPPIVPGSPQVVPSGLVSSSSGASGSGADPVVLFPSEFGTGPTPTQAIPVAPPAGGGTQSAAPTSTGSSSSGPSVAMFAAGGLALAALGWVLLRR